jgi:hypothetical protein
VGRPCRGAASVTKFNELGTPFSPQSLAIVIRQVRFASSMRMSLYGESTRPAVRTFHHLLPASQALHSRRVIVMRSTQHFSHQDPITTRSASEASSQKPTSLPLLPHRICYSAIRVSADFGSVVQSSNDSDAFVGPRLTCVSECCMFLRYFSMYKRFTFLSDSILWVYL